MPATKLTLSADKALVERAKEFARKEGTSLSSIVSRFLETLLDKEQPSAEPGPLTRAATGLAKLPTDKTDKEILEGALAAKYGVDG
jgi:hypothetical protein